MIEITSNHGKSIIFEKLTYSKDTATIIIDNKLFPLKSYENVYCVENPSIEYICNFINNNLLNFKNIIIYSNYSYNKIKPFIKEFKKIEDNKCVDFIVMYRKDTL